MFVEFFHKIFFLVDVNQPNIFNKLNFQSAIKNKKELNIKHITTIIINKKIKKLNIKYQN